MELNLLSRGKGVMALNTNYNPMERSWGGRKERLRQSLRICRTESLKPVHHQKFRGREDSWDRKRVPPSPEIRVLDSSVTRGKGKEGRRLKKKGPFTFRTEYLAKNGQFPTDGCVVLARRKKM